MAKPKKTQKRSQAPAHALLDKDRAIVLDEKEASRLWNKGAFGELKDGKLQLSLLEALFLMETGKLKTDKSYTELFKECSDKYGSFLHILNVYKDLRARGYVVKTGFKFGAHFRLYERGIKPGEGHSDFLVHMIPEEYKFELQDLSRAVRLSHSVKKKIWYAINDSEGDVTYYQIVRVKP